MEASIKSAQRREDLNEAIADMQHHLIEARRATTTRNRRALLAQALQAACRLVTELCDLWTELSHDTDANRDLIGAAIEVIQDQEKFDALRSKLIAALDQLGIKPDEANELISRVSDEIAALDDVSEDAIIERINRAAEAMCRLADLVCEEARKKSQSVKRRKDARRAGAAILTLVRIGTMLLGASDVVTSYADTLTDQEVAALAVVANGLAEQEARGALGPESVLDDESYWLEEDGSELSEEELQSIDADLNAK